MSDAANDHLVKSFFEDPTGDRLGVIQERAFSAAKFDPTGSAIRRLECGLTSRRPPELNDELQSLPWFFAVCPRWHFVEARICENLGEIERMQRAVSQMQDCLRALLQTGQGTRQVPFRITFVTDERDLLCVLGEPVRCQQLVNDGDGYFDVLTTHSGQDVWFDVTRLVDRSVAGRVSLQSGRVTTHATS